MTRRRKMVIGMATVLVVVWVSVLVRFIFGVPSGYDRIKIGMTLDETTQIIGTEDSWDIISAPQSLRTSFTLGPGGQVIIFYDDNGHVADKMYERYTLQIPIDYWRRKLGL